METLMKCAVWTWNNVVIWVAMGAVTFFAVLGAFTLIAAPHLRCMVVP